eukprot:scaffold2550_cov272-Prasinococcus_capsulatus_cf.AAC.2
MPAPLPPFRARARAAAAAAADAAAAAPPRPAPALLYAGDERSCWGGAAHERRAHIGWCHAPPTSGRRQRRPRCVARPRRRSIARALRATPPPAPILHALPARARPRAPAGRSSSRRRLTLHAPPSHVLTCRRRSEPEPDPIRRPARFRMPPRRHRHDSSIVMMIEPPHRALADAASAAAVGAGASSRGSPMVAAQAAIGSERSGSDRIGRLAASPTLRERGVQERTAARGAAATRPRTLSPPADRARCVAVQRNRRTRARAPGLLLSLA